MASIPVNAANLTQEQLSKFLVEALEYKLQIARIWPFLGVVGGKLRYERTNQLESIANIDAMATILGDGTDILDQTAGANTSVTFTVGELASRYKLDYNAQDRFRYQSIDNVLSVIACKRLYYMAFRKLDLDNAGVESGDYDSLYDMADPTRIVDMAGVAPTVAKLQETFHLVVAGLANVNAIMCNSRGSQAIIKAYNALGMHPLQTEMEWDCPITGHKRKQMMNSINGAPILINDMVETDGDDLTRIYMMVVGEDCSRNVHGVTGIIPKDMEGKLFIRRESAEPSAATTSRMNVTYTFPVATAMGCGSALAILENVLV